MTGQLQHPGIAPVYELVRNAEQPELFYTMRLINGRTLTEAARDYHRKRTSGEAQPLDIRELIGAFLSVCQVIAYAHSRGVIHRDIKGQNVVLGDFGEVMVLDWGLAKVVGEPEARDGEQAQPRCPGPIVDLPGDPWEETMQGEILGTPTHMSPEQAAGRHDLVGPRSDIYGLGAILYEILTGEPPFRGDKYEVLRRVVDEPPEPPRHRVAGLPLALEAICLKCLAKTPGDRYSSAADLARDVQRYLADEPVSAFQEPSSMKVKRWIGRHRTFAVASTATLLVGTLILSAATISLRLANKREASAHATAENHLKLAMAAVDRFFTDFGEDPVLKAHGLERPRHRLLVLAKDFYEIFAREKGGEPRVEVERANSYLRLAKLTEELGEASEAIPLSRQACSIFQELARRYPSVPEYREGAAMGLDCLAGNYAATNQATKAKDAYEKAEDAWDRLSRDFPLEAVYRYHTALTLNRIGRLLCLVLRDPTGCDRAVTRSLSLCDRLVEDHPDAPEYRNEKAEAQLLIGSVRAFAGKLGSAKAPLEEALGLRENLTAEFPGILEYQSSLVDTCVLIAAAYSNAREPGPVPVLYTKIRQISQRLAREHPDVALFAENHCLIEMLYLIHLAQSGDHERATAATKPVLAEAPKSGMAMLYAACCYCVAAEAARGDLRLQAGQRERLADSYLDRAMEWLRATRETGLFRQPYQFLGVKFYDPDLAPLRKREDFKKLVAELETAIPAHTP